MRLAALTVLVSIMLTGGQPLAAQTPAAFAAAGGAAAGPPGAPTFYADVLPILQQNCQSCHQESGLNMGGMLAPWPLVSYDDVAPRARRIANAVRSGTMPPWSASSVHRGDFRNERVLQDDEIETLVGWAEDGAPAGDPADAPPTPDFVAKAAATGGWSMGEPDLILSFDEPYCLDDEANDVYINIPVQITEDMLTEDKWIESVEYRNGPAVHHIISAVGGLVPGMEPHHWPEGYGRVFRAGPRQVVFNMHFNKEPGPGTATCTNIQAGIRFKEAGERIRYVTGGEDLRIRGFEIPAGESSYSASMEHTFEEDVELMSFMPHMHLRGKAALYEVTYPDGRHQTLLHVPKYDFNWQHTYEFADRPILPAGSVLRFTLWWDNSEENPYNPDPSKDITWGLPTHAEMSQGYMQFRRLRQVDLRVGDPIPANYGRNQGTNEAN